MAKTKIRNAYDLGDRPKGLSFTQPSLTHQSFEKEANINNLVARYIRTGTFYDRQGERMPQFGDFTDAGDFQSVQDRILQAQELFMELPSDLRLEHNNDAGQFLAWLADPANHAEAVELGLLESQRDEAGPQPEPESEPQRGEAHGPTPKDSESESAGPPTSV